MWGNGRFSPGKEAIMRVFACFFACVFVVQIINRRERKRERRRRHRTSLPVFNFEIVIVCYYVYSVLYVITLAYTLLRSIITISD